jgi:hypothetical protein
MLHERYTEKTGPIISAPVLIIALSIIDGLNSIVPLIFSTIFFATIKELPVPEKQYISTLFSLISPP